MRFLAGAVLAVTCASGCLDRDAGAPVGAQGETAGSRAEAASAEELAELASQASDLLAKMAEEPDSAELRQDFLLLFEKSYSTDWGTVPPETYAVFGQVLVRVNDYAREGDKEFLKALMKASFGPYGRSVEGGKWINELLWENLEHQPQLTITTLAELSPENRKKLMDQEYTAPVHDGFDFQKIIEGLRKARVPANMKQDVQRILDAIQPLVPAKQ